MKKNIIISVLAILVFVFITFFIFGITQQIASEMERDVARAEAIESQAEAERQRFFAEGQRVRADSLQQQLDKCK